MNKNDPRYSKFHLVNEMYETVGYINEFMASDAREMFSMLQHEKNPLMLTGEGSSRIFPAKNAVHKRLTQGLGPLVFTESATDLKDKILDDYVVIGASNSGKTKEVINLFRDLRGSGHSHVYGLSCNYGTLLEETSVKTFIIDTGVEKAVAASKSVVAQAIFYDVLLMQWEKNKQLDTSMLSFYFEQALNLDIHKTITDCICNAETVYFAGYNNGVAEELTLKTNEIIRKKSAYLPGTYLLHGVEEVITKNDVIIMIDAYPEEYEKIKSVYSDCIGTPVISIFSNESPFNNVIIPQVPKEIEPYIKLAAGWNLLVESGVRLGIDLDKPERARKIGNEAIG